MRVITSATFITRLKPGQKMLPRLLDYWRRFWESIMGKRGAGGAARVVPRSERHAVQRSLVYRRQSGLIWYEGTTENCSRSGVLFRGEKFVPAGSVVETSFEQQEGVEARDDMPAYCWARIVRTLLPGASDPRPALAARVLRQRAAPKPPPDVRRAIGEIRGPMSKK